MLKKYDLLKERNQYIFEDISEASIKTIIENINNINIYDDIYETRIINYKRKPINIYISSYGGSVYSGLGLYSYLKNSKTEIHTYVIGTVMSMGFILYLSGTKRFAYDNSRFMIHELSNFIMGKLSELKNNMDEANELQNILDEIIVDRTYIKQDKLNDIREKKIDWYINSTQAKKLNIVTEII